MSVRVPLERESVLRPSPVVARIAEVVGPASNVLSLVDVFQDLAEAADGIEHLRGLILDLAIRGMLTRGARNINDDHSAPFSVPDGWRWASLGALAKLINGDRSKNYPSKQHQVDSGIPFINAGHLRGGSIHQVEMNFITEARYEILRGGKVMDGDILYCLRGSLGKAAIVRGIDRGAIASSLVIIRLQQGHDPSYMLACLTSPFGRAMIRQYDNGTAQPNLSAADVGKFAIPVPPLAEQKRIVAKVDQLMALCDELEAKQAKKRETGTRLTKSALEALTSAEGPEEFDVAWKRVVENFDVLVDRADSVRTLRAALLELGIQGGLLPDVARGELSCLGDVVESMQNGLYKHARYRSEAGVAYVRMYNIQDGQLILNDLQRLDVTESELAKYGLRPGDVLLNRVNSRELVGKSALVSECLEPMVYEAMNIRLRCKPQLVNPAYLNLVLRAPSSRSRLVDDSKQAVGQASINQGEVARMPIRLPSLANQLRIVKRVDHLLQRCDDLEAKLRRAEDCASKLIEAVVSELVA